MMIEVNQKEVEDLIASKKPLVVDCWADWCTPCKALTPMLAALGDEYKEQVTVVSCNVEENDELAARFKIRSLPTILFIVDGKVVDTQVGAVARETIKKKIEGLLP